MIMFPELDGEKLRDITNIMKTQKRIFFGFGYGDLNLDVLGFGGQ
jgi:hypothetical protein